MKIIRASPSQRLAFLGHILLWLFPTCRLLVPPSAIKTFCHCDFLLTEEGACGGEGRKPTSDGLEEEESADLTDADSQGTEISEAAWGPRMRKREADGTRLSLPLRLPTKASRFCFPSAFFTLQICFSSSATWPVKGHPSAPTSLHPAFRRTAESGNLAVGEWYLLGSVDPLWGA